MVEQDSQIRVWLSKQYPKRAAEVARQLNTSTSFLGRFAIRQLLIRTSAGSAVEVPADLEEYGLAGAKLVKLEPVELEQLNELAGRLGLTPEIVGQIAFQELLDQVAAGAVPMFPLQGDTGNLAEHERRTQIGLRESRQEALDELDRLAQLTRSDE